jgi:copper chaperone CopZ
MLTAAHLRTAGLTGEWAVSTVEAIVGQLRGVAKVVAVSSLGIVSVMWDDTVASLEQILLALRAAGFEARPMLPGHG